MRSMNVRTWAMRLALAVTIAVAAYFAWEKLKPQTLPPGIASANGRIEATEIDIATKIPGRIDRILADEGDFVNAGQVLVEMDTQTLRAQLRQAQADHRRAELNVDATRAQVVQRKAENEAALAGRAQRQAELDAAQRRFERSKQLVKRGTAAVETFDNDRARFEGAKAAVSAAEAQIAATHSAISAAASQAVAAEAAVDAAKAAMDRIQADIDDSALSSPRDGRVQYRVAQPGEVLGAGGKALNVVDLSDVYITFFLPTETAGRVAIGAEARIILDVAPQYIIPATATFVADVAQFTPKTVETAEERQKLTFRVKAKIAPELLKKYLRQVKTGLPGVVYVRLDPHASWPAHLKGELVQ